MEENEKDLIEINSIKEFVKDSRIDDAVKLIALYLLVKLVYIGPLIVFHFRFPFFA